MSDLIRREDVFDAIKKTGIVNTMSCYNFGKLWHGIEILPSAESEERTAKVYSIMENIYHCRRCDEYVLESYSYCPSCGAKLEWSGNE